MQSLPRTRCGRNRQEMAQCRHSSKTRTHLHSNLGRLLERHLFYSKFNNSAKIQSVPIRIKRSFHAVWIARLVDCNPHQVRERSQTSAKTRSGIRKAPARQKLCTKALQLRLQSARKIFAQRFAINKKEPTGVAGGSSYAGPALGY